MLVTLHGVENYNTKQVGALHIVPMKYTEDEALNRETTNGGLVFFFQEYGEKEKTYLMSLVLLEQEIHNIIRNKVKIVKDLSYIASWDITILDLYMTHGHLTKLNDSRAGYVQSSYDMCNLELHKAVKVKLEEVLRRGSQPPLEFYAGFDRAIIEALRKPFKDDNIVPHFFKDEWLKGQLHINFGYDPEAV